jgi:hypothetical protein
MGLSQIKYETPQAQEIRNAEATKKQVTFI